MHVLAGVRPSARQCVTGANMCAWQMASKAVKRQHH